MRLAVVCSGAVSAVAVATAAAAAPSGTAVPFTPVTIEPIVGVVKTTTNKKFQRKIMWRQMRRVATCQRRQVGHVWRMVCLMRLPSAKIYVAV